MGSLNENTKVTRSSSTAEALKGLALIVATITLCLVLLAAIWHATEAQGDMMLVDHPALEKYESGIEYRMDRLDAMTSGIGALLCGRAARRAHVLPDQTADHCIGQVPLEEHLRRALTNPKVQAQYMEERESETETVDRAVAQQMAAYFTACGYMTQTPSWKQAWHICTQRPADEALILGEEILHDVIVGDGEEA